MSVASLIRQGLGSSTSDLVRFGLGSGTPEAAAGPIITLGLAYSPSAIVRLGLGGAPATSGPTAPSGVSGTATGSTTATITWTDNSVDETGFEVQLRTAAGPGAWAAAIGDANPTAADVVTFAATSLTAATAYDIRVRAKGATTDSAWVTGASSFTTDNPGTGGGAIPTYIDTGASAETDTASALAKVKLWATGQASETDTAPPLTLAPPGQVPTGAAAETDTAHAPAFGPATSTPIASAAQVWQYVMANGATAEANVLAILTAVQTIAADVDALQVTTDATQSGLDSFLRLLRP